MDGAYFRVHHFARQLASAFPLLAAVGAKTRRIEVGTAVIDMRYKNPHSMTEDAGAANRIADGRLQLGISRGSPEQVIDDDPDRAYFGRGVRTRTRLASLTHPRWRSSLVATLLNRMSSSSSSENLRCKRFDLP
jgi:alkanesulfonate monooxygenase SsuD/methylene tetrahydromethanopterin reductase-like flavin-dependent oxidoreductase (luciferase family)